MSTIGNPHGPLRWLWHDGNKKVFRNKKELDRYADANQLAITKDYRDATGRTFIVRGGPEDTGTITGVVENFKTTEEAFMEFFLLQFPDGGDDEKLVDRCRMFYMAGIASVK